MKKKILGLDLGTNSIGWAVVNDENGMKSISHAGSRIIPMDAKLMGDFESGNSISQTATRTAARGARRLYERHALRRERLNRVLTILGFLPDHFHFVLYVKHKMEIGIKAAIRGFWQGAKIIGRAYTSSINPNDIRDNERRVDPLFHEVPFIRPMSRKGQLKAMIRYVQMNPQRLATKKLMPGFFRVQDGIEIAGRTYSGVGNAKLLQERHFMPVHVRRTMVDDAEHGADQRLRGYKNRCVLAARQGTVMVSPFISEHERAVLEVLLKEKHPIIYIADNGFGQYFKPSDCLFDAVAEGRLLILSPWPYDPKKKQVTRAECVEMNKMAEEICRIVYCSE